MEEKNLKIDSFVKRCMQNTIEGSAKSNNQWYLECLNKAKNTEDFENLYFSTKDIDIMSSQAYGELLKKQSLFYKGYDKYYHYVMNKAEIKKVTCSDRGGLKLGNDTFSICVSNGYGDGVFTTAIFLKGNPYINAVDHMMNYQVAVDGKFNIYDCDCRNDVALELEGSYIVYSYNGFVALVEQDR
jgi:hypothetical protein